MLALFGVLLAPYFLDWSSYRAEFEKRASQILGQNVEVRGAVRARLLPLPSVTFHDIRVGETGTETAMMVAETFRLDAELTPLLKGEVVIVDMQLLRPEINVSVRANGSIDWASRTRAMPVALKIEDIAVENISIIEGRLRISGQGAEQTLLIDMINAKVSARTLRGPWRIDADFNHDNKPMHVFATTGRFQPSGTIRTKMLLLADAHPYELQLEGPIGVSKGNLTYGGTFVVKPVFAKSNPVGNPPSGKSTSYEALPVRTEGLFEATSATIKVKEFKADIGVSEDPYSVTGTANISLKPAVTFRVVAEGQQIALDRLAQASKSTNDDTRETALSLQERITVLRDIVEKIPKFDARGTVSLYLPAILTGDTVIREIGMDLRPLERAHGWQISNFDATFPGRTRLQANGELYLGENFGYSGNVLLASNQPSGFAGWLVKDVDPAIRKLRVAGFSANAKIFDKLLQLEDLEIALGDSRLKGALERRVGNLGNPRLVADLKGNKVDYATLGAFFNIFAASGSQNSFLAHDIDLAISTDQFLAFGLDARGVQTRLRTSGDSIDVEQLEIENLAGSSISAKGEIRSMATLPAGSFFASVTAENAKGLLQVLQRSSVPVDWYAHLLEQPSLLHDLDIGVSLTAQSNSDETTARVELVGEVAGTSIDTNVDYTGSMKDFSKGKFTVELAANHPQPQIILRQMGASVLPIDAGGPMSIIFKLNGKPAAGMELQFVANHLNSKLDTYGQLKWIKGQNFEAHVEAKFRAENIDPFLLLAGFGLPNLGQGTSADLSANIGYSGGEIAISKILGEIAGQSLSGNLSVDTSSKPRPRIDGNLHTENLALADFAKLVFGPQGQIGLDEFWPDAKFGLATFAGLDGKIEISSEALDLGWIGVKDTAAGRKFSGVLSLRDGNLSLANGKMDWLGGKASGGFTIANTNQSGLLSGRIVVENGDLTQVVWTNAGEPIANGSFDLSGSVEGSGASMNSLVANLAGGGAMTISNGVIRQLDHNALSKILQAADKIADDKLGDNTPQLLGKSLSGASFPFGNTELAYSIAGGRLRASNIVAASELARLNADVRLDLKSGELTSTLKVSFAPGKNVVTGAVPEISFAMSGDVKQPEIKIETGLLSTYLTLRAHERGEREFEAQKARILERQRLSRYARLYRYETRSRRKVPAKPVKKVLKPKVIKKPEPVPRKLSKAELDDLRVEEIRLEAEQQRREIERRKQSSGLSNSDAVEIRELAPVGDAAPNSASRIKKRKEIDPAALPGVFSDIEGVLKRLNLEQN